MVKSLSVLRYALAAATLSLSCIVASEGAAVSKGTTAGSCDSNQGEKLFKKCAVCHTNDSSGKHGFVGPNLYDVTDRPVGKVEGYKFSSSLRKSEEHWTTQLLDTFLKRPMDVYPRTRMAFTGINKPQDRADLICFLASNQSAQQ